MNYHQDEQLNTTLITDEERKLRNHYQYDAFDSGLEAIEALPNRIRYTDQQYDEQTGQYYLRARYYNLVLGRFMQEDVYQGDGLNLYAYCWNNPVVYYDPSGYSNTKTKAGGCTGDGKFGEDSSSDNKGKNKNYISDESKEKWGRGTFPSVEESLEYHMKEHGASVGATDIDNYVRKTEGFSQNLKGAKILSQERNARGSTIYKKFIIIGPDGKILSYGLERKRK